MAVAFDLVEGKWMMEELIKEFYLPFELLKDKKYVFTVTYGQENVKVDLYDLEGAKISSENLIDKFGSWVSFNQFVKFMKDKMQLPDLFSLEVTVPSEGLVRCKVGIYPQKRVY